VEAACTAEDLGSQIEKYVISLLDGDLGNPWRNLALATQRGYMLSYNCNWYVMLLILALHLVTKQILLQTTKLLSPKSIKSGDNLVSLTHEAGLQCDVPFMLVIYCWPQLRFHKLS
jgi:hypothetical protein